MSVIDITKILEKRRMVSELVDGIPIKIDSPEQAAEFKFMLKNFLEDNFMLQVSYCRDSDRMVVLDPEGKPLTDIGFVEDRVFILHPDDYIGSKKEISNMGHSYQLISKFCKSWNNFIEENLPSID